jgi:DNA-binding MarR family transcriptional regulator
MTGGITGIVDRLERAGYVRRAPHPTDRRSVIVQPKDLKEVQRRVGPIFESLLKQMATIAGNYSAAELEAIGRFFKQMTAALRLKTSKLKKMKGISFGAS